METKKDANLFDIISDLEGDSIPLDESIAMLYLFGELLSDAARWLNPEEPYTIKMFNDRLDTLLSMLSVIQRTLHSAKEAIREDIAAGYNLHNQTKQHKDN